MNPDLGLPSHQPDQLVVDLHHLDTVLTMLRRLGVSHGASEQDDRLGLALLANLIHADEDPVEVDDILGVLRQRAAADRDGWVPLIGKNRAFDTIVGEGHKPTHGLFISEGHKPTFAEDPEPVTDDEVPAVTAGPDAGRGIRIGMIDTKPVLPDGSTLPFRSGHGTFVRSLIARQAPAAEIIREDQLDGDTGIAYSWPIAQAMMRLVRDQHVDILNLSLGTFTTSGGPPLVIARAIERIAADTLVVAAAGNHGAFPSFIRGHDRRSACWPAAVPPAVAVGALDVNGGRPAWSPDLPWIDCSAPGEDIVGDYLDGDVTLPTGVGAFTGHARWSGTSFATATVSGAVAARTGSGMTPREALRALKKEGTLVKAFSVQP